MIPIALRACEPTGTSTGFGCPGFVPIEMPEYARTPEGDAFREKRVALGLTLGEASRILGLKTSDVSGLERGRFVPEEATDWTLLHEALERR